MNKDFSKIWITIVIAMALLAGLFLGWKSFKKEAGPEITPTPSVNPIFSASPSPTPSKEPVKGELTVESIKNAQYDFVEWRSFRLAGGKYEDPVFGISARIYKDLIAFGDLDGDGKKEAVAVVSISGGGSGDFRELAVMKNNNGIPQFFTSVNLGDRVLINSLDIKSGEIILNMIIHGPNDALCCPTLPKIAKYKFVGIHLEEVK